MSQVSLRDPALPALAEILDLRAMQAHLAPLLQGDEQLRAVDILKYKPGRRCAVAYGVVGAQGTRRLFAKAFATGRGAGIFLTQGRIFRALDPQQLRVPEPLLYVAPLQLLVTEFLEGQLLADQLYRGDTAAAARRMATALAALHRSGVLCAKQWPMAREISNAIRTCEEGMHAPSRAHLLAQRIARESETCAPLPAIAVHRDYYLDQLLDRDGQAVLFDLDDARQGEAALDVGNFLAHLFLRPLQFPEVAAACAAARAPFLATYHELAAPPPTWRERLRLYEATSLLRLAGVYAGRPRWADHLPERLLDACEQCLANEE